ncbi:molecular chaperone HtpG [Acetobacter suratthaniensis]|uniref:Chaperone protein HtpG n=1 Tax=Acetobacter suratthaniensis TaxID=1502841 RepID=A0ABS3LKB2_9PROT|nr:molecular chaperone HtpG [Acetobacter suratthaniensis]MBO1328007.1 molecular chaperone HtpG [Acetobacter suratthaniensis]MCX2566154.1 molecular chaperone HtpG [Acetobacter suratthaniensis]
MTDSTSATQGGSETKEFSAEVGRLLDLVVHALYSEREIFLRELVANAADATDRRRFEALTDGARALPEGAKIRINPDKDARLLTISDDGAGMSREELVSNLGTIARSGTRAFGQQLENAKPEDRPSLIGQFGVGFYAAFMVADKVEVVSRRAGAEVAWRWSSDGRGSYTIEPASRETAGTDITLHIKTDADEFLDPYRLQSIIRKWSDHIAWPVTIMQDGKEEAANEGTALWRKPRSEVTTEQLEEFYRHLTHNFDTPWETLHWRAEGTMEFSALLFIPSSRPFEFSEQTRESRIRLHVRRMFITDEAEILPSWLRFVQGVVDTEDLPLNVSREMLQATPVLARIRKAVTGKVLSSLKARLEDAQAYETFWDNFGPILKEGMWDDPTYRTEVAGLSRFRSSAVDGLTGLADYVNRMKPEQDAIYYVTGDNTDVLAASPQIEGFKARGIEVLLLSDAVDSFWPERLGTYEGKTLRNVAQGLNDLDKFAPDTETAAQKADMDTLLPALKAALENEITDVRATDRLVSSAMVLSAPEGGPDLQLRKLMQRSGQAMPEAKPVLELNPAHPLTHALAARLQAGEDIAPLAHILLDVASIQNGDTPKDVNAFASRIMNYLAAPTTAD